MVERLLSLTIAPHPSGALVYDEVLLRYLFCRHNSDFH